jgi:Kef-type K+ transport system membrane component KefB
MLVYVFYHHLDYFTAIFMAVWYTLLSFGIFFPVLVCSDQEKSGNPGTLDFAGF